MLTRCSKQYVRNILSHCKLLSNSRSSHGFFLISDIYSERPEGSAAIQGWVKAIRIQKKNVFFDVSDGSCCEKLQVFLPRDLKPEELTWGAAVEVQGQLSSTPRGQPELRAERVTIRAPCAPGAGLPLLARQTCSAEALRQRPHLRPRTGPAAALLRVRDAATRAIHHHLGACDFLLVHTPVLTSNDCEGGGETFRVQPDSAVTIAAMAREGDEPHEAYFGSKAFLTVSGQLHLEAAAQGLGRVYSFGPTFRAENSKSRLHLSEFYMLEIELAFVDKLDTLKSITEDLIKNVAHSVLNKCESDIKYLRGDNDGLDWLNKDFASLTLDEALLLLRGEPEENGGLSKEQELRLVSLTGVPTFVTHWPAYSKPFYAKACPDRPDRVLALDLLVPLVGELVGGSVRESCPAALAAKLPSAQLDWYLQLRSFGGAPTAGFGLGFERFLQLLCHIPNIKDTIPFPRWPHNCPL